MLLFPASLLEESLKITLTENDTPFALKDTPIRQKTQIVGVFVGVFVKVFCTHISKNAKNSITYKFINKNT